VLRADTGNARGFDHYDDRMPQSVSSGSIATVQRTGEATAEAAVAWLGAHASSPFFLFVHFYDPHEPYTPPEPFRSRTALPYDGEIAAADEALGRVVAELKRTGAYDRALVVLVSDHGEGLGDHGEDGHGILLYREALRVPLIVKLPGSRRGGEVVPTRAALADVLPTLATLLGFEAPAGLPGRALFSGAAAVAPVYAETYYPRIHLGWSELRSLADGRFHYVDGPKPELFDFAKDPAEKTNLLAADPKRAETLSAALRALPGTFEAPGAVDPEAAERLAALGYLGGAAAGRPGERPDPRDRLPVLAEVRRGFRLAAAGKGAEAVPVFRAILRDNPGFFDVQHELARTLTRLGRLDEARAVYVEAIRDTPPLAGPLRLALARVLLDMERPKQALAAVDAIEGPDTDLRDAAFLRGDALARLGRSREAVAAFERENAAYPDNAAAWARLAFLRALEGRPRSEVQGLLETMLEKNPSAETAELAASTTDALGDKAAAARWRERAAQLPR
jgi:tetratricopeptide (TPR) repeat protein